MNWMWRLCNRVRRGTEWIDDWNDGIIVSIKKREKEEE